MSTTYRLSPKDCTNNMIATQLPIVERKVASASRVSGERRLPALPACAPRRRVRSPEISLRSNVMARLHEYQGKAILAANGFKIPRGRAASNADEAVAAAKELAGEVVVKIQAWTTGRAGIGGVVFAKNTDHVRA